MRKTVVTTKKYLDELEAENGRLREALSEIAASHLTKRTAIALGFEEHEPAQHCTHLVRIARNALKEIHG